MLITAINLPRKDLKYKSLFTHSRPCYGYDAKFDPTILDAVRNTYVDVSCMLITAINLPRKTNMNVSSHPRARRRGYGARAAGEEGREVAEDVASLCCGHAQAEQVLLPHRPQRLPAVGGGVRRGGGTPGRLGQ
jgi:hypothetical protein